MSVRKLPTPISKVEAEPNEHVVELLESLLADAKAGKIQAFICCYERDKGQEWWPTSACVLEGSPDALLIEMELLRQTFLRGIMQAKEEASK